MGEIVPIKQGAAGAVAGPKPGAPTAAEGGRWEPWEGGRCWVGAEGRRTYYIRKRLDGRRVQIKTSATSLRAALEALGRFERDPSNFTASGDATREAIHLDADLTEDFLRWSKLPRKEGGAGNTSRWVTQQKLYLAAWADHLKGRDLRRLDLARDINPAIKGATCRPQRIAVIKRLYSWLRKVEHRIGASEDPTFGTLSVPQYEPAQHTKSKARTKEELLKVRRHLPDRWRDVLDFLMATGAHVSEVERFAREGTIEALPKAQRKRTAAGVVAGIVVLPKTKTGGAHRVRVSPAGLAAAQGVLAAGPFDQSKLRKALTAASVNACVPKVTPGTMRHTVATAAVNAGEDMEAIADAFHHADKRTTARWYATLAAPAKIKTLI